MQRHLFLCGEGALELIEKELGERLSSAGGYITRTVPVSGGEALGLLPAAAAGGIEGFEPQIFLRFTPEALIRDNEVFRSEAVRLMQESLFYPFALIGELGGFELVIPQYRAALGALLNAPLPCIGALRPARDARMLAHMLGLGERFDALYDRLRASLAQDGDTLFVEIDGEDDPAGLDAAARWAEEYAE